MTIDDIKLKLKSTLTPKRFNHSLNVMECAVEMAARYGEDAGRAAIAGLLHDCARDIKGEQIFILCGKYNVEVDEISRLQPEILHGPLGARIAEEDYGIRDSCILNAIRYHTTGCENMGSLEKIIFLADFIEPSRNFAGIEDIRRMAYDNIDNALVMAMDKTIAYVISKRALIHPTTIKARNFIILSQKRGHKQQ